MWYYSQNNQQMGPVAEEELKTKLRSGVLVAGTLVWKEGMGDWKPVSEVAELAAALTTSSPTLTVAPKVGGVSNPYTPPVSQPAPPYPPQAPMGPPINGGAILGFAIAVTLLCCLPFGVAGIVYAAQINSKQSVGDYAGAAESARKAKLWNWLGFGFGLVICVIYGVIAFTGASRSY
jgi:hypothetical protein